MITDTSLPLWGDEKDANFGVVRVLFSSTPGFGHVLPLLPLARAFLQQGDEVAFSTNADGLTDLLAAERMDLLPAGPTLPEQLAELVRRTGVDPGAEVAIDGIAEFFAGVRIDLVLDEALAAARAWKPDLIVSEHYDFVGQFMAAALDIPAAAVRIAPPFGPEFDALTAKVAASRYADRGLTASGPRWYLDTIPTALKPAGAKEPAQRLTLRPEAHRAAGWRPAAVAGSPKNRPEVLVTFGTLFSSPAVVGPILQELAKQDIDIKVTLGPSASSDYELDTDQVTLVEFTPFAELIEGVDVVVAHGGAGTTLGVLSAGIPLVVTPVAADQFLIGGLVEAAGAGIALPKGTSEPTSVANAVADVLADTRFAAGARKVAAEIAEFAAPEEVAGMLKASVEAG